jgi:hypothetical protein
VPPARCSLSHLAGAYPWPMTEPAPAAPAAPEADPEEQAQPKSERIGTILMTVAIAGVVIVALDVALKGKLLAPLFALLPAPKAAAAPEETPSGGLPDAPE